MALLCTSGHVRKHWAKSAYVTILTDTPLLDDHRPDSANALGLWVHQAAASVTEKRGARSPESAPHRRSTWPTRAEPFEETILDQESDYQQSGVVGGPISQR